MRQVSMRAAYRSPHESSRSCAITCGAATASCSRQARTDSPASSQPVQVADRGDHVGGIGAHRAARADQPVGGQPFQQRVQHHLIQPAGGDAGPEFTQDRMVETGVGQVQAQRVFPVDAGADMLGGLTVRQILRLLEDRHQGKPGRRPARLAARPVAARELLIRQPLAELVAHQHRQRTLTLAPVHRRDRRGDLRRDLRPWLRTTEDEATGAPWGTRSADEGSVTVVSVVPIDTPSLGDRSYLVSDGEIAVVIDPQRDIDRVLQLAGATGVRITQVFETHVHNDYVSGGLELARVAGADYLLAADDAVAFPRLGLGDRAVVQTGALTVRALRTPGHTFTHLSYLVEAEGRPVGVFTGGSLLYGSTGRPDLLGSDATRALVRAQYRSARRLAAELPADTPVYPTHGFGSFCSASQSEADSSTLAQETRSNPVLTLDEDAYVEQLLAGLGAYPTYYAQMAPVNRAGPAPVDLSPPVAADVEQLRRRLAAGEWVVDLRPSRAFAHGHAAGTVSAGMDGNLAIYLGWVMPWGTPVTLLGETREQRHRGSPRHHPAQV